MPERDVLHMRLDPETAALLDGLARRFGLTRSAAVRQAVRRWADAEGLPRPTPEAPDGR
jgi:hypothetical protein